VLGAGYRGPEAGSSQAQSAPAPGYPRGARPARVALRPLTPAPAERSSTRHHLAERLPPLPLDVAAGRLGAAPAAPAVQGHQPTALRAASGHRPIPGAEVALGIARATVEDAPALAAALLDDRLAAARAVDADLDQQRLRVSALWEARAGDE